MGLKKEVIDEIVPKIIAGDNDAFSLFKTEYGAVITHHVKKYYYAIYKFSYGLYDFEDIEQEIWYHVLRQLPKFDSSKASIMTWMYVVCEYKPYKILRDLKALKRHPGKDKDDCQEISSLDFVIQGGKDDGKDSELIDFIADPREALEHTVINDFELYEYIYILKDFVKALTDQEQIIYLHSIKGLTQMDSAALAGVTQVQVSRVRQKIFSRIIKLKEMNKKIDIKKAVDFASKLILKEKDEKIARDLKTSLAVVKICKEVLNIAMIA